MARNRMYPGAAAEAEYVASQQLAAEREARLAERDEFNRSFKEAQADARAQASEGKAQAAEARLSVIQQQNEAMNAIRQKELELRQQMDAYRQQQMESELTKQSYELKHKQQIEDDGKNYMLYLLASRDKGYDMSKAHLEAASAYPLWGEHEGAKKISEMEAVTQAGRIKNQLEIDKQREIARQRLGTQTVDEFTDDQGKPGRNVRTVTPIIPSTPVELTPGTPTPAPVTPAQNNTDRYF